MPGRAPSRPWAAAPRAPVAVWRLGRCGGRGTHRGGRCGAVRACGQSITATQQRLDKHSPLWQRRARGAAFKERGGACPPARSPLAESTEGAERSMAATEAPPRSPGARWGRRRGDPRNPPSHRDRGDIQHVWDAGVTRTPWTPRTSGALESQEPLRYPGSLIHRDPWDTQDIWDLRVTGTIGPPRTSKSQGPLGHPGPLSCSGPHYLQDL